MHIKKEKFAEKINNYVINVCNQLSDCRVENKIFDVLGINKKDLKLILRKIINALPEYIYIQEYSELYNKLFEHLAREYILFQAAEKIDDQFFIDNLSNFIYEQINNINYNFYK